MVNFVARPAHLPKDRDLNEALRLRDEERQLAALARDRAGDIGRIKVFKASGMSRKLPGSRRLTAWIWSTWPSPHEAACPIIEDPALRHCRRTCGRR